jgi:hypothetical protein
MKQKAKSPAPQPTRKLTSREEFENLSPADRFKLLSDAEFDAIGFERLYRNTLRDMESKVLELQTRIKQLERAGEDESRVINQQSLEIRNLGDDKRALIRRLKELEQEPLRS